MPEITVAHTAIRPRLLALVCLGFTLYSLAGRGQESTNTAAAAPMAPAGEGEGVSPYRKLTLEQLMSLDVTSVSRGPEPYGQAPAAIQVITSEDIRRSGATSIPESLRLADNLEVAQKNAHDWAISARGFNTALANKLLVLIDGRSVYTPLFSGVFWDVQDYLLQDLDRIEVISGPGGTLWGANAVNGVINITTKDAKDTQGIYAEAGGGSALEDFAALRYGGALSSNVCFRVYGKYFEREDEVYANGQPAADSVQKGQGGFRLDADGSAGNHFTVQGDLYGGNEHVATGGDGRVSGGNVLGRWTHTISDESDLSLQLYYYHAHLADPLPGFLAGTNTIAPSGLLMDDLDTWDLDFQHRLALGERNRVVWGLGYRFTHDVTRNAPPLGFFPAVLDQNLYSFFAQDELKLMEHVFFTAGTKIEHNDYTGLELEPSGRLQWNWATNQMVWGAISRAVRTPSRIDRDFKEPEPPYTTILRGNSSYGSEKVLAYELGYRTALGSRATGSLSAFYNDYQDIRSVSMTPTTILPLFFENNVEGYTYGFELSGAYEVLDWWRLRAGYDLLKENIHVKPGETDFTGGHNEVADPQQQWSLRSSMDLPQHIELDGALRWVDELFINNGPTLGKVPSYFELDVRVAWHPVSHLELAIVGQNLLHAHHPEYGYPNSLREEIGRSVYGKVTWRF